MPRLAQYDRKAALDKAVALFWARGYHSTSLKQLERALDMRPGSLYAAFGNKQGLFLEALDVYAGELVQQMDKHLNRTDSHLSALKSFLRELVLGPDRDDHEPPARACMIVKTLLEVTEDEEPLGSRVNELLTDIEEAFEDLLRRAQREGELRADVDCVRLARLVQVQIMGLRTFAQRSVVGGRELKPLLDDIDTMLDRYRVRH